MAARDDYPNLANLASWRTGYRPSTAVIALAPHAEQAHEALDEIDRLRAILAEAVVWLDGDDSTTWMVAARTTVEPT